MSSSNEFNNDPFKLLLDRVLFLLVSSMPVGVNGLTFAAGCLSRPFLSVDLIAEPAVKSVLVLVRVGAGVAKTGVTGI